MEMELLLVCPQGFDYPPEVVAEKMCELPLLHPAPSQLIISSDCLAFAPAFKTQLGSQLIVDYSWDDQHTEDKAEPAHIEALYLGDVWSGVETFESFGTRLWGLIMQKKAKRVVLCGQGTISTLSQCAHLSICKMAVQSNAYPTVQQAVSFEEMQQLFKSLRPPEGAQVLASTVASSVIAALRDRKGANVSFQPYLTTILAEQLNVAMDRLEEHYNQQISTAVEVVRAKQSEYCSTITRLNQLLQELEISLKEVGEMISAFQPAPAERRAVGVPGGMDPQLPEIAKGIEQYENSIKILYEEVALKKQQLPLKLTVSSGSCIVENRKLYELQDLELLYSEDDHSFKKLLDFTSPAGQSTHSFAMPQMAAKMLTFVIRQNGTYVCDSTHWQSKSRSGEIPYPPPPSSS